MIFVGYHEDWRDGLEEYGRANSSFKPPLAWEQAIPFGWNSWAAYGGRINYSKYVGAADFINRKLAPNGFNHDKILYLNLDASWSHLDVSQMRDALQNLLRLGRASGIEFRPGIYMAPFAQWGDDFDGFVEGTNLEYRYPTFCSRSLTARHCPSSTEARHSIPLTPEQKHAFEPPSTPSRSWDSAISNSISSATPRSKEFIATSRSPRGFRRITTE